MKKISCLKFRNKIEFSYLSMEDFGERVLAKREKAIQTNEAKNKPADNPKPDLVDEKALQGKIDKIKAKIENSPVATNYKESMRAELKKILDKSELDINNSETDTAKELAAYSKKLNENLDNFNNISTVKEVHDVIEPFFTKQEAIIDAINLETYKSRSGYWKEINKKICRDLSIDKAKIEALQKHLQVKIDGKIGPETINAIAAMLGVKIDVKFGPETKKAENPPQKLAEREGAETQTGKVKADPIQKADTGSNASTSGLKPASAATQATKSKPPTKAPEKSPESAFSRTAESSEKENPQILQLKKQAQEKAAKIGELVKVKQTIETQVLPFHFTNMEKYIKENSIWTSFDEDGALKETIKEIAKNEQKITEIDSKVNALTLETKKNYGQIFTKQYAVLKAKGVNTDQFLLMVDSQLDTAAPKEMTADIKEVKARLIKDPNTSQAQRLLLQGKYSEAMTALGEQNRDNQLTGQAFNFTDVMTIYQKRSKDASFQYTSFEPGSFAAQKLGEGYIAINPAAKGKVKSGAYLLMKRDANGTMSYIQVDSNGGKMEKDFHNFTAADQGKAVKDTEQLRGNLMLAITKNPNIQMVQDAGALLQSKFVPMQRILMAGMEGGKTSDVVQQARKYATEIKDFNIYKLRRNLTQAKEDMQRLRSFSSGHKDEFEQQIMDMEKALSGITDMVQGQKIENFCNHILNEDEFNQDNFKNWFMKEGIVMLTAIVVATSAMVLLVGSGGTGAPAAILMLAKAAAIGTAAGMVGSELAHAGMEVAKGTENRNRSLLGKYVMEQADLGVKTGEQKFTTGVEVAKAYLQQFAVGTVTTFATMGLGKGLGTVLSKYAGNHAATEGIKGALARLAAKIPKLKPQQVEVLEKKGLMAVLRKMGEETTEELLEEAAEGATGEIDRQINQKFYTKLSPFSTIVNFYTSLSGGRIEHSAGEFKIAPENVQTINGEGHTKVVSDYSYDVTKATEMVSELQKAYGSQPGFKIDIGSSGEITVTNQISTKKGEYTNVINLKPTTQSIEMKRMLSSTDGRPIELTSLYGVESSSDNVFTYETLKPEKKLDLAKYLKKNGFKIDGDPARGNFTATKDGEVVTFKKKQAADAVAPGGKGSAQSTDAPVSLPGTKRLSVMRSDGPAPEPLRASIHEQVNESEGTKAEQEAKNRLEEATAETETKNESEKTKPADDKSANPEVARSAKAAEWKKSLEQDLKGLKAELQDTVKGMVDLLAKGVDIGKGKFNDALKNWAKIRTEVEGISQKLFKGLDVQFREMAQIFKVEWTSIIEDAKEASSKAKEAKKTKKDSKQESRNKQSKDLRQNFERKEYAEVIRETDVFYVPDIHGDVNALHSSLLTMGLVNNNGDWIGQNKVLQFSGDYIDRGKSNLATLDYLSKVQKQVEAAGGRVDLLMGNHEALMIGTLIGDPGSRKTWLGNGGREVLKEVMAKHNLQSNQENEAIAVLRRECLEPGGKYYELIQGFKPASQVDDVLYVHAGVSPKWSGLLRQHGVEGINARWKQALERGKKGDLTIFNEFNEIGKSRLGNAEHGGLFWIDFQQELATMSDAQVTEIAQNLKAIGINAIVVGHSQVKNPTLLANFQKQGIKLIASDVSMSHAYGERAGRGSDVSGVGGVKIDTNGSITAKSSAGEHELHTEMPKAKVAPDKKADEPKAKKTKKNGTKEAKEQAARERAKSAKEKAERNQAVREKAAKEKAAKEKAERDIKAKEAKYDSTFQTGDVINILRSSGKIDPGWFIKVLMPNGDIVVEKMENGRHFSKTVSKADIVDLNPKGPASRAGSKNQDARKEKAKNTRANVDQNFYGNKLESNRSYEYSLPTGQSIVIDLGPQSQIRATMNGDNLVITQNGEHIATVLKGQAAVVIGRNSLPFVDPMVSGSHLRIGMGGNGKIYIIDIGSSNGTRVNSYKGGYEKASGTRRAKIETPGANINADFMFETNGNLKSPEDLLKLDAKGISEIYSKCNDLEFCKKILGLNTEAFQKADFSEKAKMLKNAYRKLSPEIHPDKVDQASNTRLVAEELSKIVNAANEGVKKYIEESPQAKAA